MKFQILRSDYKWLILFAILQCVRSEEFLTEFQSEMDNILKDFDASILHTELDLSSESTEPPSSPKPIKICIVSPDEYADIYSIVDNFSGDFDNPSITIHQSTTCTETDEFDRLKLWMLQFRNDFNEILKIRVWSDQYYTKKIAYEHLVRNFGKHMDNLAKKVSAKGKDVMTKLRKEYDLLQERITTFYKQLENKQRQINEKNVKLCVAELKAARIDEAVKIFSTVTEERLMRQVVSLAYENEDSFERIFDFIGRVGQPSTTLYGYQFMFVKFSSKIKSLNQLIFLNGAEKYQGSELKSMVISLQKKLNVVHKNNDYADIYAAINNRISANENVDFGRDIMTTFIRGAYNSTTDNVVKILDMRSNFVYMRHQLYLIDSLITEMKIQDHTYKPEFIIVVAAAADMKREVDKRSSELEKQVVKQIHDNMPINLRSLMYPNLCIQNAKTNEYIHAGSTSDNGRRNVFTSVTNTFDDSSKFVVEFLKRGPRFLVKNSLYGEYLYVTDGEAPRKVMLMKGNLNDDEHAFFTIEAVDSINVRIKTEKFKEYLYSPTETFDQNDRRVHSKSQISEDSLWQLTTCEVLKD